MAMRILLVLMCFAGISFPGFLWLHDPELTDAYTQEWDVIERMSAGVWFMATVWCAASAMQAKDNAREWVSGSILFFLLGFRELDGHIWMFGWNLDKLVLYWKPAIPFHERLLVLCIGFLILSWLISVFPPRRWKHAWMAYQAGAQWTRDVLLWLILIVSAMLIDKSVYLPMYRQSSNPSLDVVRGIVEESLELTLAFYTLLLLFPLWSQALLITPLSMNKSQGLEQRGIV